MARKAREAIQGESASNPIWVKVSPTESETLVKGTPPLKSQPTSRESPATGVTATDHCFEPLLLDAFVVPTTVIDCGVVTALTVMVELPCFVVSATDVAVKVIEEGLGTLAGAE